MSAIFRREFRSYFTSPFGYAILAACFFIFGLLFTVLLASGNQTLSTGAGSPDISLIFSDIIIVIVIMIAITPVLTMRLLSEEKRQKTDQVLLTSTIRLSSIVLGKFFAAFCVYAIGISITLVYQIILACYGTVDWMVYLDCVLGALLLGGALIAIGEFISSLTGSSVISFVCSMAISLVLLVIDLVTAFINNSILSTIVSWISFYSRYVAFTGGILDYSNAVFFLSFMAVFLFLTVRVLEAKRWA